MNSFHAPPYPQLRRRVVQRRSWDDDFMRGNEVMMMETNGAGGVRRFESMTMSRHAPPFGRRQHVTFKSEQIVSYNNHPMQHRVPAPQFHPGLQMPMPRHPHMPMYHHPPLVQIAPRPFIQQPPPTIHISLPPQQRDMRPQGLQVTQPEVRLIPDARSASASSRARDASVHSARLNASIRNGVGVGGGGGNTRISRFQDVSTPQRSNQRSATPASPVRRRG